MSFEYDDDGLLLRVGELGIQRSPVSGRVERTVLGSVATEYIHDGFGDLQEVRVAASGTVLWRQILRRDKLGRVTGQTLTKGGATTEFEAVYDAASRMVEVSGLATPRYEYSYDTRDNLVGIAVNGVHRSAVVNGRDELETLDGVAFTHDLDGMRVSATQGGSTVTYSYETRGHLRSAVLPDGRLLEFDRDSEGRVVRRRVDGSTSHLYIYGRSFSPLARMAPGGQVVDRYVYSGRTAAPDYFVRGGVVYAIVVDHVGSVRLVVNAATGDVAQFLDYDPWGNVILDSEPGFQPFGFAGGMQDSELGLVMFGARYYDPRTARWLTPDPARLSGRSTNLYAYALGDPINNVDLSGLDVVSIGVAATGTVGGGGTVGAGQYCSTGEGTTPPEMGWYFQGGSAFGEDVNLAINLSYDPTSNTPTGVADYATTSYGPFGFGKSGGAYTFSLQFGVPKMPKLGASAGTTGTIAIPEIQFAPEQWFDAYGQAWDGATAPFEQMLQEAEQWHNTLLDKLCGCDVR